MMNSKTTASLSQVEFALILRALLEGKAKIEAMPPYQHQDNDLKLYDDLVRKLTRFRDLKFRKKTGSRTKRR